jgi:hypothetical protein
VRFKYAVLGILACAGSVQAQIKPQEEPIQHGFETFRSHPGIKLTLDGVQQIGDTSTPLRTITYWYQDVENGRPMAKLEMQGFVAGVQTYEIVGDGVTLWAYDLTRSEYSASRYGNYNGNQPAGYVNSLLGSLRSMIKGYAAYPVRLLSESYGGENARYTTWAPGGSIEDTGLLIRYSLGNPVWRSMDFSYSFGSPYVNVTQIDYFDEVFFGGQARDINWTLTPLSSDVAPTGANFQFVPPTTARPVSGVRPVTGG